MKKLILLFAILAQTAWGQTLTVSGTTYNIHGDEWLTIANSWTEGYVAGNRSQSRTSFEYCNIGVWERDGSQGDGLGLFFEMTPTTIYFVFDDPFEFGGEIITRDDLTSDGGVIEHDSCSRFLYRQESYSVEIVRVSENRASITVIDLPDPPSTVYYNKITQERYRSRLIEIQNE